jgi:hypothetical protein
MTYSIEKLSKLADAEELGTVVPVVPSGTTVPSDNLALILDLPLTMVVGMPLHAAVFAVADTAIDTIAWTPDQSNNRPYSSLLLNTPGLPEIKCSVRVNGQGGTNEGSTRLTVLRKQPRITFAAAQGTPESDALSFMRFIYGYRDYIIKAAVATGWPNTGICPRLIAAVAYRDFLQRHASDFARVEETPFFLDRLDFGGLFETERADGAVNRLSTWDVPLGICQLPLFWVALLRRRGLLETALSWVRDHSIYTWVLDLETENELIMGSLLTSQGWTLPETEEAIRLCNLARFSKSNIYHTAQFLEALRTIDASLGGEDPIRRVGPWQPNLSMQDSDVVHTNVELCYLLAAFDRLRNLGFVHTVEYRSFASEVLGLAQLPAMDLFFNVTTDYGGYALQEGDSDKDRKYAGIVRASGGSFVQDLATDLHHLGFATAGKQINGLGSSQTLSAVQGKFEPPTDWAVREFQVHAGMERIAMVEAANDASPDDNDISYELDLRSLDPNPVCYLGPISGVANIETRALLQYWKRHYYRCPVNVTARHRISGTDDWSIVMESNLWHRRQVPWEQNLNNPTYMFAQDLTGYYPDNKTVTQYPETRPDNRVVAGWYFQGDHGGPVVKQTEQPWAEAKTTWEALTGSPWSASGYATTGARASTMRVVLAVDNVESGGHFDRVNAWDGGYVSVGLCHWTLALLLWSQTHQKWTFGKGELGAFLAYFKRENFNEFNRLFRRFGIDVPDWGSDGSALAQPALRNYIALPRRLGELDALAVVRWDQVDGETRPRINFDLSWQDTIEGSPSVEWNRDQIEYFRTWPFFYRFVMAGRAGREFRRRTWDMARIRLRDLRDIVWVHNEQAEDYLRGPDRTTPAKFRDVFTSERTMALIHRWHVNKPSFLLTGNPPEASTDLRAAFRAVRNANHDIFYDNSTFRHNVSDWIFPTEGETVIANGIIQYIQQKGWTDLYNTMIIVRDWSYTETIPGTQSPKRLGNPFADRDSFDLDLDGLPLDPPPSFTP